MTPTQAVQLIRFIAGRCPAMRMQDNTAETWYIDLVGYDLPDALEAARRATLDRTFIGIGDLVRECEAIVRHREGAAARARLEAQVLAENPGADPKVVFGKPPAELSGGPAPEVAVALVLPPKPPGFVQRRPADMLREAAAAARRAALDNPEFAELVASRARHRAAVDRARAEMRRETPADVVAT